MADREQRAKVTMQERNFSKFDPFGKSQNSMSKKLTGINEENAYIKDREMDFDREMEEEEAEKLNEQQKEDVKDFFQSKRQPKARAPRLLSINDPRKTQWDLFVMLLATFNVFVIPLDVGF